VQFPTLQFGFRPGSRPYLALATQIPAEQKNGLSAPTGSGPALLPYLGLGGVVIVGGWWDIQHPELGLGDLISNGQRAPAVVEGERGRKEKGKGGLGDWRLGLGTWCLCLELVTCRSGAKQHRDER
jgi:hypothetical protein